MGIGANHLITKHTVLYYTYVAPKSPIVLPLWDLF
uniref:Uncharacterized protein n=1 Tax=Siphoviridae sp. ctK0l2 TaxID=2826243 RepID=A0A8S5NKG4_9CAUD|nr:MAG TPA: hypothetical protein [Siphoviridae sp. ctK0l2]